MPFACGDTLTRGMVAEWSAGQQMVVPWLSGSDVPLGVCTSDADFSQVDIYCGKGASVLIKCAPGIVPNPNDFLFWAAPGLVSNVSDANPAFARAIAVGINGYVEAIIV
jgi:hypothetical protein